MLFSFALPIYLLLSFGIVDVTTFIEFNNYSDQVRLILWTVGLEHFLSSDNYFFGLGYEFTSLYANYLIHEMKHVHNIYLQVLFTSGIIGFIALIIFFISWLISSFRQGNLVLLLQVLIVMTLGLIETVYSDSRVFVLICFFLGFSYRNYPTDINHSCN